MQCDKRYSSKTAEITPSTKTSLSWKDNKQQIQDIISSDTSMLWDKQTAMTVSKPKYRASELLLYCHISINVYTMLISQ